MNAAWHAKAAIHQHLPPAMWNTQPHFFREAWIPLTCKTWAQLNRTRQNLRPEVQIRVLAAHHCAGWLTCEGTSILCTKAAEKESCRITGFSRTRSKEPFAAADWDGVLGLAQAGPYPTPRLDNYIFWAQQRKSTERPAAQAQWNTKMEAGRAKPSRLQNSTKQQPEKSLLVNGSCDRLRSTCTCDASR